MSRYGERTRVSEAVSALGRKPSASKPTMNTMEVFNTAGTTTFTVPIGITNVVVYLGGGGGGVLTSGAGGDGGDSSFAFAGGTVTAKGGKGHSDGTGTSDQTIALSYAGTPNSCDGAFIVGSGTTGGAAKAGKGAELMFSGTVTPLASISLTVGAGGTGTLTGGSGYVRVEYGTLINSYRVETFLSGGTFTPPIGVSLVKATIVGGGGSSTTSNDFLANDGTASSIAFAGGTITAAGGEGASTHRAAFSSVETTAGANNSGRGATARSKDSGSGGRSLCVAGDGGRKVVTAAVTGGTGITVTIGAGGTNGAAGGTGFATVEYYV